MQGHLGPKYIVIMPLLLFITILIITAKISIPLLLDAQAENASPPFAELQ
jgi:hypothetical protein